MEKLRQGFVRLRCCVSVLRRQRDMRASASPLSHVSRCTVHTSSVNRGLEEFFDEKEKVEDDKRAVGRPWRKEELRIKSNEDLHKLWFVLLKERNQIMTMQHMYYDSNVYFPNPERIDKVEESMENVLEVVKERDEAYKLLEEGDDPRKKPYATRNMVGIPYYKTPTEHYIPKHMNRHYKRMHPDYQSWMGKYLDKYEEKLRQQYGYRKAMHRIKKKELMAEFPHLTDEDFEDLKPHMRRLDRMLEAAEELGDRIDKPKLH